MDAISRKTGLTLTRTPNLSQVSPGHWLESLDGQDAWTGSVLIVLSSMSQVQLLRDKVHGLCVVAGNDSKFVEVRNGLLESQSFVNSSSDATVAPSLASRSSGNGVGAARNEGAPLHQPSTPSL